MSQREWSRPPGSPTGALIGLATVLTITPGVLEGHLPTVAGASLVAEPDRPSRLLAAG